MALYNARHEPFRQCAPARSDQELVPQMSAEIEVARAAVAQRPQDAGAHFVLAQAYDQARETDAAIDSASAAVRLAPWFAQAHHLLGILLARRGDFEDAIDSFRRAISARPGYA